MSHIKQTIENLLFFLEPHLSLANCHMVDFFTKNSYKNYIPQDIQDEINQIGEENTMNLIFQNEFSSAPNLRNFVESSTNFTLKNCAICLNSATFAEKLQNWGCDNFDKFKLEIFMSAKKSHEVEILSGVAAALSKISKVSHLVDLGDGKGYLSSMIALKHQIPVLGVDASNINTCGAIKRATKLSKIWKGIPNAPHRSHPKKTEDLTSPNIELYKQVTEFVGENFDLLGLVRGLYGDGVDSLGLVGLHTCGDLSPNSLKIFTGNQAIRMACNVGCCYHLLSEEFGGHSGFPLSQFLRDKGFVIGRGARMIANQSVERVLQARELPNISIFYRAILQVLLEEFCTELPTKHVGKFRKLPETFLEYSRVALKRIDVTLEISDDVIERVFSRFINRLNELNIFYLIRSKLSPVIESLILLDRLLFLHEQGIKESFLVQFFDPVVSPRCYGIVALKTQ